MKRGYSTSARRYAEPTILFSMPSLRQTQVHDEQTECVMLGGRRNIEYHSFFYTRCDPCLVLTNYIIAFESELCYNAGELEKFQQMRYGG